MADGTYWEGMMSAVQENQPRRRKGARQMDGRRSDLKECVACRKETRWLSVDQLCWECTIAAARTKIPLHIEPFERELPNLEVFPGTIGLW